MKVAKHVTRARVFSLLHFSLIVGLTLGLPVREAPECDAFNEALLKTLETNYSHRHTELGVLSASAMLSLDSEHAV